ncbi:putative beta-glucosidase [Streptomyces ambofaciens ATCC 23877]|uniref:beta-glucosidase n=1 Tax=Streptomyces ambofaciens (strain ATCC 23877 / 3486 / DSM 40053 / JCM 4204 / NBRC 12836 / NRRL B-2516) TaxID=278992 RepID=A0ACM7_STRA7|nr:family 1 glycosylhydrolase [Streptomyces ambofaciens]AKZ60111.1 putative beta-glucosidase [Streptomyces ambofaciens ATCC 23877]CAJ88232.1 putative beta-glucosidase [Streptomyces ambofaciens ATCC 23877]
MTPPTGPGLVLPHGFLMGASTSAHQVEGNNVSSDWWVLENRPDSFVAEPSGDAADSFHRWPQDMDLLSELGFNAYRFGIEWARVEPERGRISRAAVAHYRDMVRGALARGLTPVVTLHHFTSPRWFSELGGWSSPESAGLFAAYAGVAAEILAAGVRHVVTINEPNMVALMHTLMREAARTRERGGERSGAAAFDPGSLEPDADVTRALIRAHRAARGVLRAADPGLRVGWTVANQVYQAEPGAEEVAAAYAGPREDVFLEAAREDDWVGVQAYTRHRIGPDGPLPVPQGAETTLTGWEVYPQALGEAVRHTAAVVGPDVPILVTENGIATDDDALRISYTRRALAGLAAALRDGVDVRGYLHWSALDNYEWGSYRPTFGLIAVDPHSFARRPKESARWLGSVARSGRLPEVPATSAAGVARAG